MIILIFPAAALLALSAAIYLSAKAGTDLSVGDGFCERLMRSPYNF
jgi:hypothetical protein